MLAAAALLLAACPHPYMPLTSGATWSYAIAGGEEVTLAVEEVVSGEGWLSASVATTSAGIVTTFTCGDDGLVLPFGSALLGGRVEILEEHGVSLPADAKPGATWESTRVIRVKPAVFALASKHRVAGVEKVKTPAGAFDALRVDVVTAVSRTKGAKPDTQRTTLWFARDVGLVKMEGEADVALVRRRQR